MRIWLALLAGAVLVSAGDLVRLERELDRLEKLSGGLLGVTAIHVETGEKLSRNGRDRFPMASTFKVPVAVELFARVDRGEVRLDEMVDLKPSDLHPGSGTLTNLFNKPGVSLSVRNLVELMLLISDNSATDLVLAKAGGARAVTAKMQALGLAGIRVDRSTAHLISDMIGAELTNETGWSPEYFRGAFAAVPPEKRKEAAERFRTDPRDTATPDDMAALLVKIHQKALHRPESAELLLDILKRCQTGENRIRGMLPPGMTLAHKTGTIGGTTNDVGILTLPDDLGHVVMAIFIKNSTLPTEQAEKAIAQSARAIYDYFLYTVPDRKFALAYDKLADRILASLQLQPGERVLIRRDPDHFAGLTPFLEAGVARAGARTLAVLDYLAQGRNDDAGALARLLNETDVYLWMPFRDGIRWVSPPEQEAIKRWVDLGGVRRQIHFHWQSGSILADGLPADHPPSYDELYQDAVLHTDYPALRELQDAVIAALRQGTGRIRTPAGTNLIFRINNRPVNRQDGDASPARARASKVRVDRDVELPAGVVRVAPIEANVQGTLVLPEARFGGALAKNVRFEFEQGRIVRFHADEGRDAVAAYLAAGGPAALRFREIGIGVNPKLRIPPGQKVLPYYGYGDGVVRLSLGDNEEVGGDVRGGFVRWFFVTDATVDFYGEPVVKDGRIVIR
jgi:beta-lactamase class A